ncbi:MAG: hypothetical protein ACI9XJ_001443 [Marivirga sp.]|jgi:hypothetical protein
MVHIANEAEVGILILYSTSLAGALALFVVIIFATVIELPFILRRLFILTVWKAVDFTLRKDVNNPVSIPISFVPIVIALISFTSYWIDKIT